MSIFNGNCGGGGGSSVAGAHASTHGTGGSDQLTPAMISAAPASHTHTPAQVGLPNAESTTNKNQPNGYAGLNASGQIPTALLPSYVDDIVEVANLAALPATGDASVIYVTLDTSKAYRWGGSAYAEIPASPGTTDSVAEGSVNLYFTAARAAAAQVNADWNSASGKSQILNKPALGTAASKDVAATGNATAGQVVLGSDTRLSDPRTPVAHTHPQSEVTGLVDALDDVFPVAVAQALTDLSASLFVDMLPSAFTAGGVPAGLAFARGSTGTYFGPDGLLRTAGVDVLRHEWSPSTGEYQGALIEESRTNLLTQSSRFDQSPWVAVGVVGFTPASGQAPDGTTTAVLVIDNDNRSVHGTVYQAANVAANTDWYSASVFVKLGTANTVSLQIHCYDTEPVPLIYGVAAAWDGGGDDPNVTLISGSEATCEAVGGGWYRLTVSGQNGGFSKVRLAFNAALPLTGKGTALFWGAQLEAGRAASSYIPTTSSPVTRSADSLTSPTAGWLRQGVGAILLSGDSASAVLTGASGTYRVAVADGQFAVQNGGASVALPVSGSVVAATYAAGASATMSASGLRSGTPAAVPDLSLLTLSGRVRMFAYFPQHLADDVLQGLARTSLSVPGVSGARSGAVAHTHPQTEVTGLVDDLAGLTLSDRIPSRADFEARAAAVRAATAGSGFVEWGGHHQSGGWYIADGLWLELWGGPTNILAVGGITRNDIVTGVPVASCNGFLITMDQGWPRFSPPAAPFYIPTASPPAAVSLPARHDLIVLEVWHERVDAKDVVYPFGCVQYIYPNVVLTDGSVLPLVNNLVAPAYSAFGAWQVSPTPGCCARWSTMTDAQKKAFAANPANNVYQEADGSVIQVRWRIRYITGAGTSWYNVSNTKSDWLGYDGFGDFRHVIPRGQDVTRTIDMDVGANINAHRQRDFGRAYDNPFASALGAWVAMSGYDRDSAAGYRGQCYAMPFALLKRERNTGIYHATHNPGGCAVATGADPTSLAECFALPKNGGLIASGVTGHPRGLYADQVIPADVSDLRMNVCRPDPRGILRTAFQKYRGGALRRKTSTIQAASVVRDIKAAGPVVSTQGLEVEPSAYNPATGELVYPTAYVGAGAVTAPTLINKNGQAVMQVASDPAMDGIVDIDLADGVSVELPYFFAQEG